MERTLQFYEQLEIQPGELELAAIVHHIQYHYGVVKRYRGVSSDIDALIERLQGNDKEIYKARRIQPDDRRKLWYYSPKAIQRLGEQYKAEYESYPEIPEGWIDFDVLLERLTKNLTTEHKITDVAQVKEQIRQFRRMSSKQKNINIYLQKCRANGHIRLYYSPVAYEAIYSQCVRDLK